MDSSQLLATIIIFGFSIVAWISEKVNIGYGKHFAHYIKYSFPPRIGWIIYEIPNLLWILYYFPHIQIGLHTIPLILFTIHYLNRDLIYPFRISPLSRRLPIEVVLSAIIYTTCNGYIQVTTHLQNNNLEQKITISDYLRIFVGLIIFFYGMTTNIKCDNILRSLKQVNSNEYKIPNGNLFQYVSSGHYLAEIIEWFGYWIVSGQFSGFLFFAATLSILSARAVSTHKWYQQKFNDYPKSRQAIIPYVL